MTQLHKYPHFTKNRNTFIGGATRGGKTVIGNEIHAESDRLSIFWNPEEEDNVVGNYIQEPKRIIDAIQLRGWNAKIDYRPKADDAEGMEEEFLKLQRFLFKLADVTGRKRKIQVIVDECQDIALEGKNESGLHVMVRKGLKRMIRVYPMSQDPSTVSKVIVRQCDYNIWTGKYNPYYTPYFKTYNLPVSKFKNQREHHHTLLEKAKVIDSGLKAKAKYA